MKMSENRPEDFCEEIFHELGQDVPTKESLAPMTRSLIGSLKAEEVDFEDYIDYLEAKHS